MGICQRSKILPVNIHVKGNGEEGLKAFRTNSYDLVIMDLEMPVMDGYEACAEMRKIEEKDKRKRTEIIALTAHAFVEIANKCIESGFDEHLSKPIKKKTLLRVIENACH